MPSVVWKTYLPEGLWLVGARGRLDHTHVAELETALSQLLSDGCLFLVIDLTEVEYLNSGSLRALVSSWRTVRREGGDIYLAGLSGRVQEILEIVRFQEIFRVFASPADAVAAMVDTLHE